MNATALLYAMVFVGLVLIGGTILDHLSRAEREDSCLRAGGAYVAALSGFACTAVLRE